jgi:hypothetical protein
MRKIPPELIAALWRRGVAIAQDRYQRNGFRLPEAIDEDDDVLFRKAASSTRQQLGFNPLSDDYEGCDALYDVIASGYKAWCKGQQAFEESRRQLLAFDEKEELNDDPTDA